MEIPAWRAGIYDPIAIRKNGSRSHRPPFFVVSPDSPPHAPMRATRPESHPRAIPACPSCFFIPALLQRRLACRGAPPRAAASPSLASPCHARRTPVRLGVPRLFSHPSSPKRTPARLEEPRISFYRCDRRRCCRRTRTTLSRPGLESKIKQTFVLKPREAFLPLIRAPSPSRAPDRPSARPRGQRSARGVPRGDVDGPRGRRRALETRESDHFSKICKPLGPLVRQCPPWRLA